MFLLTGKKTISCNPLQKMYQVILYYNFSQIDNPDTFTVQHKKFCKELGLKGRIYISSEGINGTVGGTKDQITTYKNYLCSISGFESTGFKEDESDYECNIMVIIKPYCIKTIFI